MKLEVSEGELKQGYWYVILTDKGESIAAGYRRLEKHAYYDGEKALAMYKKVGA